MVMDETQALLATTYFGPVQWYQKLNRYGLVLVERYDSFRKQTFRNRCVIATTNGLQALTVPVERGEGSSLVKDVRISDHGNWRHLHWHALLSAYSESPFFEYYADDLRPFFERKWEFLYDYNMEACMKVCELLDLHPNIQSTNQYAHAAELAGHGRIDDFRDAIDPKHPLEDGGFKPTKYYQVFQGKHGFLPNLSILDLLFNMGPEGIFFL
jgi:hypothetical protein